MSTHDKAYLDQIDKFYSGKLKSYQIIKVGNTPEFFKSWELNFYRL